VRQEAFERAGAERWRGFERSLGELDAHRRVQDFPRQYRLVCQDLVLARDRQFDVALVARLNALALRGHQHLYGARTMESGFVDLFVNRFPRAVRREWRLLALMCLCFYGTLGLVFALSQRTPELVYSILDPAQAAQYEEMYDPASEPIGEPREATEGVGMFFFYLGNNLSVDIRTFAGGILFGIGSLFIVIANGVLIGATGGHLVNAGFGGTFWPFVIGHSSFELAACVLSGVAGMRMGLALIVTGRRSRGDALRAATRGAIPILYGVAVMTLLAAVIEALWSGQPAIPANVRYGVGGGLWVTVFVWLALGGRRWTRR
jgi:uncharacterized membrane protein SpoIIM required for sporulation